MLYCLRLPDHIQYIIGGFYFLLIAIRFSYLTCIACGFYVLFEHIIKKTTSCGFFKWRRKRDSNPRGCYTLSVFKTDPFSQTWVFLHKYGGSGRNRTADTRIFSPLLYLLSYRAINTIKLKWRSRRDLNPRSPV